MNKVSRRKFLQFMSAIPLIGSSSTHLSTKTQQTKTIHVLSAGNPYGVMLPRVNDLFTKKTGIKVNFEVIAARDIIERVKHSAEAQNPMADVISIDQIWHGMFVENGWIKPLDAYVKADSDIQIDDFVPQVLYALNTYRGQLWSLPVDTYAKVIIYRRDLLEAQGLPLPPKDPAKAKDWTWNKYLDYIKQLHGVEFKGAKFFGTTIVGAYQGQSAMVDQFTHLTLSHNARWFKSFPDTVPWDFEPTITSNETLDTLKFLKTLYRYSPPEALNYSAQDGVARFARGDIAIATLFTPHLDIAKDAGYYTGKPSNVVGLYDAALLPTFEAGGKRPVWLGGWNLGIAANSPAQDEAWQYIKWATSSEAQKAMGLIPDFNYQFSNFARTSLLTDPELIKRYPHLPLVQTLQATGEGKHARPPVPIYPALTAAYGEELYRAVKGDIDVEDALDNADIKFREYLSAAKLLPYTGTNYEDTFENTQKLIASLKK